jgi:GT2 family glycosyltransferase
MNKVFYCIPTYKEYNKVSNFLELMKQVKYEHLELIIVNANPGDNTSKKIKESESELPFKIIEIEGSSEEYWSSTLNRGLVYISENLNDDDWVIISNIDISFEFDIVSKLVAKASVKQNCQIGALAISECHVMSSGVIMKSWFLTKTFHPLAGMDIKDIPVYQSIEVDYLPGRCFIFPAVQLLKVGLIDAQNLPHYHADYEFSNRLKKNGCIPFIDNDIRIYVDMQNTGLSIYNSKKSLLEKIRNLISIKNPSNPKYRINFVFKVFPKIYIPSGIVLYLARTFVETFIPEKIITKLFGSENKGYSGVKSDSETR